jgi:2-polyprenyl-3-methyl-5-hydroxy-6-metoxy-1,4-benzoquinol methylase
MAATSQPSSQLSKGIPLLKLHPDTQRFIDHALPFAHWGQAYFDIRSMELMMLDGMFPGVLEGKEKIALDVGCGVGFAASWLSPRFARVDGTDIEELGVAFRVERPSPIVGNELMQKAAIGNVSLHCGDTFDYLRDRPATYDLVTSVFVMEHVEEIQRLCDGIAHSLKPGGQTLNVVPNTHDTIIQLLVKNLNPFRQNFRDAWRLRTESRRAEGRRFGSLFAPITHSEFISDYRQQFDVNSLERYVFPMIRAGLVIRDVKPCREHSYAILAEKPA